MTQGPNQPPPGAVALPPPPAAYKLSITQVSSFLLVSFRKLCSLTGSAEDLERFYQRVQTHNLLCGWWAFPVGPIWTSRVLSRNRKALEQLHQLASSGTVGPGWYSDPTGHHAHRRWDGQRWTDEVRDVSTDPV